MSDLTVPQGDYGYPLAFTITEDDGTAYNLTGYTVTMKVWFKGRRGDPIVTGTCTNDVEADGTCHYTVVQYDFDSKGDYRIELELTKAGVVESTRHYTLKVEESA